MQADSRTQDTQDTAPRVGLVPPREGGDLCDVLGCSCWPSHPSLIPGEGQGAVPSPFRARGGGS